ncbi:MAG: DUF4352 domain-containing protein [Bacteroidia bacterium]|nr:DUF4352 domain-containing protein [Bacteroidia bacterium]
MFVGYNYGTIQGYIPHTRLAGMLLFMYFVYNGHTWAKWLFSLWMVVRGIAWFAHLITEDYLLLFYKIEVIIGGGIFIYTGFVLHISKDIRKFLENQKGNKITQSNVEESGNVPELLDLKSEELGSEKSITRGKIYLLSILGVLNLYFLMLPLISDVSYSFLIFTIFIFMLLFSTFVYYGILWAKTILTASYVLFGGFVLLSFLFGDLGNENNSIHFSIIPLCLLLLFTGVIIHLSTDIKSFLVSQEHYLKKRKLFIFYLSMGCLLLLILTKVILDKNLFDTLNFSSSQQETIGESAYSDDTITSNYTYKSVEYSTLIEQSDSYIGKEFSYTVKVMELIEIDSENYQGVIANILDENKEKLSNAFICLYYRGKETEPDEIITFTGKLKSITPIPSLNLSIPLFQSSIAVFHSRVIVSNINKKEKVSVYKIGDKINMENYQLQILDVVYEKYYSGFYAKKSNKYVAVEVLINNSGNNIISFSDYNFHIVDEEGFEYSTSFSGKNPDFGTREIYSDKKARGWLTYEILESAQKLELVFTPKPFTKEEHIFIDLSKKNSNYKKHWNIEDAKKACIKIHNKKFATKQADGSYKNTDPEKIKKVNNLCTCFYDMIIELEYPITTKGEFDSAYEHLISICE